MLGVLVWGFGGAGITGACGSNEPAPLDPGITPPNTPAECPAPIDDFYKKTVDKNGSSVVQHDLIIQVNRNAHGGKIHSDLAGFMFPCEKGKPKLCPEPDVLEEPPDWLDAKAEVHHVVPMKDKRCCPWGTNSNKNAAVISHKLNVHFTNNDPPMEEVEKLNNAAAYTP